MKIFAFLLLTLVGLPAAEEQKPNILWITSEDNDTQWLGCYGNQQAQTPNLDQLATRSLRFTNFYSNAPVCAVARSTIINGVYAPSQGTQHMRSRHPIPASIKSYVSYLHEDGYYCTNASKTDYNFRGNPKAIWDECSSQAHYKNRATDQPFFAIFNLTMSHESSLFPSKVASNRKKGNIPEQTRLSPDEVIVPPYLPDLPEIRSDIATYHDNITSLDTQIGDILAELEKSDLSDNTIIFYYADHGGILPRGKRYLTDTGVRVPLLIHLPERWQSLSPFLSEKSGTVVEENAAFIDLAPTLLSILGREIPDYMQGRAFLGEKRKEPSEGNEVFLFADRFDELYGMRRGLTDGRWKYIRRFTPHFPAAPYSYYQFGQPGWLAWQKAWKDDSITAPFTQIWEENQPVEELYDTTEDRWEIKNLAGDPAHQERLSAMRKKLNSRMVQTLDTGIIPEPMFAELAEDSPIADYAATHQQSWPSLVDLAFLASERNSAHLPLFIEKLSSPDPIERYWATQACLILGEQAKPAQSKLEELLNDSSCTVRSSAAYSLIKIGDSAPAFKSLLQDLSETQNEYAQQNIMNIFTRLDALEQIDDQWVKQAIKQKNIGDYVKRIAERLAKERGLEKAGKN